MCLLDYFYVHALFQNAQQILRKKDIHKTIQNVNHQAKQFCVLHCTSPQSVENQQSIFPWKPMGWLIEEEKTWALHLKTTLVDSDSQRVKRGQLDWWWLIMINDDPCMLSYMKNYYGSNHSDLIIMVSQVQVVVFNVMCGHGSILLCPRIHLWSIIAGSCWNQVLSKIDPTPASPAQILGNQQHQLILVLAAFPNAMLKQNSMPSCVKHSA